MRFGLKESVIQRINNVFAEYPRVEEVIIYGSRAKGTARPGSDIDLTLKGDNLDLSLLNEISWKLDDLLLPYMIDLSIYDKLSNPEFIDHINRVGKEFYKRKNHKAPQRR